MRRFSFLYVLLALTLSASICAAGPAWDRLLQESATQPVLSTQKGRSTPALVSGLDLSLPGRDPAARAGVFFDRYRDLFLPGDASSEVRVSRTVEAPFGPVVQMHQYLDGCRVFGGSLVISEDVRERTRLVINGLRPLGAVTRYDYAAPRNVAVSNVLSAFEQNGRVRWTDPEVETIWWPAGNRLEKGYLISFYAGNPLGQLVYLAGGPEGNVIFAYRRAPTASGYAYESSPLHAEYVEVDLPNLTSTEHLNGEYATVYNCLGSSSYNCSGQLALPDQDGNYLIEPTGDNDPNLADDAFAEVQVYYAINFIHDYIADVGLNASPIDVSVNWSAGQSANAMYMGDAIVIGQVPDKIDLALENDVIYHEYGHHVFHSSSGTGFFEMDAYGTTFIAGAIDEGTADYYSCTALNDPVLGEYWASEQPNYFPDGYLRNLVNDHHCPESLIGETHEDSLVWSPFAWKVRELIGKDLSDTLYLDVISHFPDQVNFPLATQVFLERAALVVDASTVDQMRGFAEEHGIDDCERFIELTVDTYVKGYKCYLRGMAMVPAQMRALLPFMPGQMHYYVKTAADDTTLDLREYAMQANVVLLIREDQPVEHTFSFATGLSSTYDFSIENGVGVYDLLDPQPETPFEPGHTYWIHPCNESDPDTIATIKGKSYKETQEDGGTDGGGDGGTDGGTDGGADSTADGGGEDGGVTECPDGWDWTPEGCVPICKSGYKPEKDGDTWTCVPDDSGCGCRTNANGPGLWLLFGLALLIRRRRCK